MTDIFAPLAKSITRIGVSRPIGRVVSVGGGTIAVRGLQHCAALVPGGFFPGQVWYDTSLEF